MIGFKAVLGKANLTNLCLALDFGGVVGVCRGDVERKSKSATTA